MKNLAEYEKYLKMCCKSIIALEIMYTIDSVTREKALIELKNALEGKPLAELVRVTKDILILWPIGEDCCGLLALDTYTNIKGIESNPKYIPLVSPDPEKDKIIRSLFW